MNILRGITYTACIFALIVPTVALFIFMGIASDNEARIAGYSYILGFTTVIMAATLVYIERVAREEAK